MDVTNGEVTLIADQPAPGLTQCGSPVWSHDGRRILFDATPGNRVEPDPIEVDRSGRRPADRDGPGHRQLSHLLAGRRPHRVPVECRRCTERRVADERRRFGSPPARRLRQAHVVPGWPAAHDHELRKSAPGDVDGREPGQERRRSSSPTTRSTRTRAGPATGRSWQSSGTPRATRLPSLTSATRLRPKSRKSCGGEQTARRRSRPTRSTRPPPAAASSSAASRRAWRFIRSSRARPGRRNDWGRRDTTRISPASPIRQTAGISSTASTAPTGRVAAVRRRSRRGQKGHHGNRSSGSRASRQDLRYRLSPGRTYQVCHWLPLSREPRVQRRVLDCSSRGRGYRQTVG